MTAKRARIGLALAALVAIAVVPTAMAAKGGNGKGKAKGHVKPHPVTYVFKGYYQGDSQVDVRAGNRHARRAGYVGEGVDFDLSEARLIVADTNDNGSVDLADVYSGDWVLVKARMAKQDPPAVPHARKLIDQTNPPYDDGEDDGAEDPEAPEAD